MKENKDKNEEGNTKKGLNKRKILATSLLVVSVLLATFLIGYKVGYDNGQVFVAGHIRHNVSVVTTLSSPEVQSKLKENFPDNLNYTQLFIWQSTRMNFTQKREVHTDPLEILDYGKGACGEFSIVYVAIFWQTIFLQDFWLQDMSFQVKLTTHGRKLIPRKMVKLGFMLTQRILCLVSNKERVWMN